VSVQGRLYAQQPDLNRIVDGRRRTLANRIGIGKDAVAKIWADHNLKPWKVETFKVMRRSPV
jgi:hypothetical protein